MQNDHKDNRGPSAKETEQSVVLDAASEIEQPGEDLEPVEDREPAEQVELPDEDAEQVEPIEGDEQAESTDERNVRVRQTIRLLVGGYLIYIAWTLRTEAFQGRQGIIFGIFMIFFAVVGVIVAFYALKALRESDSKDKK